MMKKVLLVDDDMVSLRTMHAFLRDTYNVVMAKSPATALMTLGTEEDIDFILLDYEMPICDGLQTLALIRSVEKYKRIPVFFMTGVTDPNMVREALKYNPAGYLLKTLDRKSILARLGQFLNSYKPY